MVCPICLNPSASVSNAAHGVLTVNCPQCERFAVSNSADAVLTNCDRKDRWKVSAWLVQYKPEILTSEDIENALKCAVPSLSTRAERMLRWLVSHIPAGRIVAMFDPMRSNHGEWFVKTWAGGKENERKKLLSQPLVSVGWCLDDSDLRYMMETVLSKELGWLTCVNNESDFFVSPQGLMYLEGQKDENSKIGFCAMWFSDEVKPLWINVIEPAIRAAGYEPLRIDSKQHNGKIDDEIMASIRGSRFVVADFTGSRGGVYYEAGFAHGLDLPVIFMCREGDDLHFDIRQYNCIFWKADAFVDAQERLKNRILATLGQGPLKV